MTRRRLVYAAALAGSVVFYLLYQMWFSWVLLLAVLGLPWFSLLLSLPAIRTFRVEITGPDKVTQGSVAHIRLRARSSYPSPPFKAKLELVRSLTGETIRYTDGAPLPCEHCGALRVQTGRMRVYDYFGLISIPVRGTKTKTVLVRPIPQKIDRLPDLNRYTAHIWRPKRGGGFAENHELRPYRPGDNLNQVHWKLSAKTGQWVLREPMEPESGAALITMNLRGDASALDRKFGRLLWLGRHLLERQLPFELYVVTAAGIRSWSVCSERELENAVDELLCCDPTTTGDLRGRRGRAVWRYHIGGEADEG